MLKIEDLKFDEKGLIPAVVVDTYSKKVLTGFACCFFANGGVYRNKEWKYWG